MALEDAELLAHYVARGAEAWNGSLEAAWLDYELRAWARVALPARRPITICNVGIGVGTWDDWLGHEVQASITSVDRDAAICRTFALRQRRENHPHPARVVCADAAALFAHERFDAITLVGSTLAESGDAPQLERAAIDALTTGGVVLIAEVGTGEAPRAVEVCRLGDLWLACREQR